MLTKPVSVSVITPTWKRHDLLLRRCVPSVQAQQYLDFEHLIISDGPDPELAELPMPAKTRLIQLQDHEQGRGWGNRARRHGISIAAGGLIAYLDDDDEWLPPHLSVLAAALAETPDAKFAYSRAVSACGTARVRIGDGPLAHGRIVTGMIMHRAGLVAAWPEGTNAPDWETVRRWLAEDVKYVSVDAVTHVHWPSEKTMPAGAIPVAFPPWRELCASAS